jgi:hypothetical protein
MTVPWNRCAKYLLRGWKIVRLFRRGGASMVELAEPDTKAEAKKPKG